MHTFLISKNNSYVTLKDEFVYGIEPGLSVLSETPDKVPEYLNELIKVVKNVIPESKWSSTPLALQATAGLRLLSKEKSNILLEESKKCLNSTGFLIKQDYIRILDGSDEGIYSWFTINYLIDKFKNENFDNIYNTVTSLDLGGSSAQLTFAISPNNDENIRSKDIHKVRIFDKNLTLYAHSFLSMGVNNAREKILQYSGIKNRLKNGDIELYSHCVHPKISNTEWQFGCKKYLVKNITNDETNLFSKCLKIVKKVFNKKILNNIPSFSDRILHAGSHYYGLALRVRNYLS